VTNAADQLYREVAFVAYHFHWTLDAILDLDHATRRRFVGEIDQLRQGA
jgi:hypothetical protein